MHEATTTIESSDDDAEDVARPAGLPVHPVCLPLDCLLLLLLLHLPAILFLDHTLDWILYDGLASPGPQRQ